MKVTNVDELVPAPPVEEHRLSGSEKSALSTGPLQIPKKRKFPVEAKPGVRKSTVRISPKAPMAEAANKIAARILEMSPGASSKQQPPDTNWSQDELDMGRAMEMEHTDDPAEAEAIAIDHLKEDPQYYSKMHRCGIGKDESPAKSYMVGSASATGSMTGTTSGGGF